VNSPSILTGRLAIIGYTLAPAGEQIRHVWRESAHPVCGKGRHRPEGRKWNFHHRNGLKKSLDFGEKGTIVANTTARPCVL
jgi:hypothetical protein